MSRDCQAFELGLGVRLAFDPPLNDVVALLTDVSRRNMIGTPQLGADADALRHKPQLDFSVFFL